MHIYRYITFPRERALGKTSRKTTFDRKRLCSRTGILVGNHLPSPVGLREKERAGQSKPGGERETGRRVQHAEREGKTGRGGERNGRERTKHKYRFKQKLVMIKIVIFKILSEGEEPEEGGEDKPHN